jgi:hypothetical protein
MWRPYSPFREAFHKDSLLLILSNVERGSISLQEIRDHFIVDLKV